MSRATTKRLDLEKKLDDYEKSWSRRSLNDRQRQQLEADIEETNLAWNKATMQAGLAPLISIIMSVYNTEKFIKVAVQSILDQTFSDFELLVIDDGSADSSIDIVRTFNDPRIRIIHQSNHGLVYSFNKGIRLARAEFIARMDSDDIALPSRLEKEFAWITADKRRGLVGTFFTYIDEASSLPTDVTMTSPLKHIDIVRMMYFLNPYGHGSILMRKQAVEEAGGYRSEYEPSEDYDLWRRIAQKWQIGQIPEVLYLWRYHAASISNRKAAISNSSADRTIKNMFNGPVARKSTREILRDYKFYRQLNSPLTDQIAHQYVDHQHLLSFKFLVNGKLRAGYATAFALYRLRREEFYRLWKTLLWAPIKYILERGKPR